MASRAALRWASCLVFLAAVAAAGKQGTRRGGARGDGAPARSDSGRSLLPASEQADGDLGVLEDEDDARGLRAGLAPWAAQSHLAVQQEYRRLSLPMLACRSRFIGALRAAGPEAEHAVNAALEAGRAFLDRVVEDALAHVPLESAETDSEIVVLQASLDAGTRYPAGDVLEARWRRAVRLSRTPPDAGVLEGRARLRGSARPLCRVVGKGLKAAAQRAPAGAKATVTKLWKCLQHRLLPRRVHDHDASDGA